jgi:hypothetical protein
MLTASLEKAFTEASKLSVDEQDALAVWILEELESERLWDRAFSDSSDKLAILAEVALKEHKRRRNTL